jgi:glyoxylase-like metal-dependent hydrolase (beta-lactamase superfamily II)
MRFRHPDNVAGDFYVDTTCIDCDLCRQIAPRVFGSTGEQSAVLSQPRAEAEELLALKALITCPTASIGTQRRHSMQRAVAAYPEQIENEVHFCGFASRDTYGGASYLIRRQAGNVLVDSPRFNRPLARALERSGGVRLMFLTHRDDVGDHDKWARHFGAERVLHRDDARGLGGIERLLVGADPVPLASDLVAIPTPGHTRGHMVLLYRQRFLFSGDHLWAQDQEPGLAASRGVCWYSWPEQIRSMRRLGAFRFEWVLPGHGRRLHAAAAEMRRHLAACVADMESD